MTSTISAESNIFAMAEIMGIPHDQRKENDKLQVIVINSLKGGCGKTTSLVNIVVLSLSGH